MLSACGAGRTSHYREQLNAQQQGFERDNLLGTTPQSGQVVMLGVNLEGNQRINQGANQEINQGAV